MVENSSAGLVMLGSEVAVTVTREDQHQAVLARYRPGATVAVELAWCAIRSGKHRGEQAIEVRLDGRRVGELTYLMSRRYGSLVSRVAAAGGRPGCAAVVEAGAVGLELTLRLPKNGDGPVPTGVLLGDGAPAQDAARPRRAFARPLGIAAAVVALVVVVAVIGDEDDRDPAAEGTITSRAPVTTTTTTATTTTTTPTTTPAVPAKPATKATPPPAPKTPPPPRKPAPEPPAAPPPAPEPKPKAAPEPASACHPNYSGCVPVAEDVDCAGGSGNGPAYAQGPIEVIGADVYDLDRDGDGTACDG